jgi:hypothetical protein
MIGTGIRAWLAAYDGEARAHLLKAGWSWRQTRSCFLVARWAPFLSFTFVLYLLLLLSLIYRFFASQCLNWTPLHAKADLTPAATSRHVPMSETPPHAWHQQPDIANLSPESYTAQRLVRIFLSTIIIQKLTIFLQQHATPEHLHITSRRFFIGPIPVRTPKILPDTPRSCKVK